MAAAYDDESSSALSGEVDDFPDLVSGARLDVELGEGMVRLCPCVVVVVGRGAERNMGIKPGRYPVNIPVHAIKALHDLDMIRKIFYADTLEQHLSYTSVGSDELPRQRSHGTVGLLGFLLR